MLIQHRTKTAFVHQGAEHSYGDLIASVHQWATLIPTGTKKVAILSENRPEWFYCLYAGWVKECVVVPIDIVSSAEEVAYILDDCTPELLIASEELAQKAAEAILISGASPETIIIEKSAPDTKISPELVEQGIDAWDMEATAVIIYTSGTTGSPKGVMLSFGNLVFMVEEITTNRNIIKESDRLMVLLPLHHVYSLVGTILMPMSAGSTVYFCPSLLSEDILRTLGEGRITILIGVPRLFEMIIKGILAKISASKVASALFALAKKVNSPGFSKVVFGSVHRKFGGHMDYLICGGAALHPQITRDFQALGFDILEGYGMTETSPMISYSHPTKAIPGSAGFVVPGVKVAIKDGEICAQGPNVMQGYYNRPEETSAILKDGWLHTGDLGHVDERGYLFVTGRKKEIIVLSNGKNLNPEEMERSFMELCPAFSEVGIYPQDDRLKIILVATAHVHDNTQHKDPFEFCKAAVDTWNRKVSPYKKITGFTFTTNELPRTRLGKLKRFDLPSLDKQPEPSQTSHTPAPTFPEYELVRAFLAEETSAEVFPDSHLEIDLSLDSLCKVSLQSYLGAAFGIELSTEQLEQQQTVEALARYVLDHKKHTTEVSFDWKAIVNEKVEVTLPRSNFTLGLFHLLSNILLSAIFRFRVRGTGNIPKAPCILASNHQSALDGLLVAAKLSRKSVYSSYFLAKIGHVKNRVVRYLADTNNVVVVDIQNNLKGSIQTLASVLRQGKNVIIFPEGTRSVDGSLGVFRKTYAILSKELNVPVVPICVDGSDKALPKNGFFLRLFTRVNLEFLEPVYPAELSVREINANTRARIFDKLEKFRGK